MKKMFIRLDDACPNRDIDKWDRMEILLDRYGIKPLVGIIPDCKDPDMDKYGEDEDFWSIRIPAWKEKEWTLALHGYQHIFNTDHAGINPVNNRSEFAGLSYDVQREKIRRGYELLKEHGITPLVFIAPAHTFDENTLNVLYKETPIRVISDTIANDVYFKDRFLFIPQQSGKVRRLPFKTITFCYHPNLMEDKDFLELEVFLKSRRINSFEIPKTKRKLCIIDYLLMKMYFLRHRSSI